MIRRDPFSVIVAVAIVTMVVVAVLRIAGWWELTNIELVLVLAGIVVMSAVEIIGIRQGPVA